jgi:hypothetical protein
VFFPLTAGFFQKKKLTSSAPDNLSVGVDLFREKVADNEIKETFKYRQFFCPGIC